MVLFWHCHHGHVEVTGWGLQVRAGPGGNRKGQEGETASWKGLPCFSWGAGRAGHRPGGVQGAGYLLGCQSWPLSWAVLRNCCPSPGIYQDQVPASSMLCPSTPGLVCSPALGFSLDICLGTVEPVRRG